MIKYKNLYLVGTSHISKESVKEVEKTIDNVKPKLIALELDKSRFALLKNKQITRFNLLNIKRLGFKVFLLNLLGAWLEKRLGKKVGTEPGAEMKKAIDLSSKLKLDIYLIDQEIKYTLNRFLSKITRKEKFQFIKDLIIGESDYKLDLSKKPSQKEIESIINKLKFKYPTFYTIIVKERNEFMARNLYKLMKSNPTKNIVSVVGAGHEKAIIGEIKLLEKI